MNSDVKAIEQEWIENPEERCSEVKDDVDDEVDENVKDSVDNSVKPIIKEPVIEEIDDDEKMNNVLRLKVLNHL